MSNKTQRPNGFYKVQYANEWIVAQWLDNQWLVCGIDEDFQDEDFHNISEIILPFDPSKEKRIHT